MLVNILTFHMQHCGGAVASWLVRSPPDLAARALAAGDIALCSWERHNSYSASLLPGV